MSSKPQYKNVEPNISRRDGAEGTTFRARVRVGGDRKATQTFDTLEEARAWVRTVRAGDYDVEPRTEAARPSGTMTWAQWHEQWLEMLHVSDSTRATYVSVSRNHLLPVFGGMALCEIRSSDVMAFQAQMRAKNKKKATIDKCRQVLGQTMSLALADGLIASNPTVGLPRRRSTHSDPVEDIVRRYLAVEQLDRLEKEMDLWWRLAVRVQIELGCRIGELAALRVSDVDLAAGVVHIRGSMQKRGTIGRTKTQAGLRSINTLMPQTAERIAQQVEERGQKPGDLLFTGPRGGRLDQDTYRRRKFNPAMKAAGLGRILEKGRSSTHVLRHTLTTNLVQHAGMSPQQVAILLGHKDSRVTDRVYLHLESSELPDNRDKLAAMYRGTQTG
ncbi:tyrosine-type recombinase/integrase [Ornithinimicrobium murale]|uniref:tyrosine-type recombinase/integrase n=1 Tax=Ornithinimicrobium murale TaxID=1050153 RepID=UPI000E0D4E43|nr:site-specific integrase [Ornithinimicrobium murale]